MDWSSLGTGLMTGGLSTAYGAIEDSLMNNYNAAGNIVSPEQLAQAQQQAQSGIGQQQAFLNALQGQNGIQNQSNVFNQLQGVANGTGPNPAQAMLNQATGANVANQAALMAGQRGAGANAGMIARQAAQQGAATQQQAVGQGATLQAQQGLNALGQMGSLATQQVGQQQGALNAYNSAAQGNQGQLLGAGTSMANANNAINAGVASGNQTVMGNLIGGVLKGAGSAAMMMAEGGSVGPSSFVGRHLSGRMAMAEGGKVPALVSPGERYLPPAEVKKVASGKKDAMSAGEKIPGKPKYKGNNYANDTVPKTLKEGGIVIPNAVLQSKDPHGSAAKFVAAVLAKQGIHR